MLLKHKAYSNSQNPDEWATLKNKIQQVANPNIMKMMQKSKWITRT